MATNYQSPGYRPIAHGTYIGDELIDGPRAAALAFATREARKNYGKSGYCHHVRLDSYSEDRRSHSYQAFIGKNLPRQQGGGCQGHNVHLYVRTIGEVL